MTSLRSGVKMGLMKKPKFNIDKFFKELLKPYNSIYTAICDSGHKKFIELDDNDEKIFEDSGYSDIEANFQNLDKSFKCSPILEIRDGVDNWYYYNCQYFHLSTIKSKYSFVIGNRNFNADFDSFVLSEHQNIEKKDIKNLSIKVLENLDKSERYCEDIYLNKSYIWGTDNEYKKLKSDNIIPPSLKKFFLPMLENKKKGIKEHNKILETGEDPVIDIKNITSTIYILNEKDIKKIDKIKYFVNVKGAIWGRIDKKKNMVNWR